MTDTADPFDFMLDYTEPTTADHWELVEAPTEWEWTQVRYRDMDTDVIVHLWRDGTFNIGTCRLHIPASLIDRLQSLKALARQHFGQEWGE